MLYDLVITDVDSYSSRIRSFPLSETIEKYKIHEIRATSFNPNDGVSTTCIVKDYIMGNYLAVYETGRIYDDAYLHSRWFIMDAVRTTAIPTASGTQHRLVLKRDVLTDYKKNCKLFSTKQAYILKGTLDDRYSPFCLNKEDISLNQIKKEETLLKDETGMKWIVGYVPRNWPESDTTITVKLPDTTSYDVAVSDITSILTTGKTLGLRNAVAKVKIIGQSAQPLQPGRGEDPIRDAIEIYKDMASTVTIGSSTYLSKKNTYSNAKYIIDLDVDTIAEWNASKRATAVGVTSKMDLFSLAKAYVSDIEPNTNVALEGNIKNLLNQYSGKRVLDKKTNKVYLVSISYTSNKSSKYESITNSATPKAYAAAVGGISTSFTKSTGQSFTMDNTPGDDSFALLIDGSEYEVSLTEVVNSITCKIPSSTSRFHLSDSPYDMFAMPIGKYLVVYDGKEYHPDNEKIAMALISAMDEQLGNETSYDFQLLPYCPCREYILGSLNLALRRTYYYLDITNAQVSTVEDSNKSIMNFLIWCKSSDFSFNIPLKPTEIEITTSSGISNFYEITPCHAKSLAGTFPTGDDFDFPSLDTISLGSSALEVKLRNQCDMLRLCSPNYSTAFEFSSQANGGVNYINVDCSYKPYNPYLHLNPDFGGLYGNDYNDQRGLVCGGDYSLARVTSSWAEYQLNNKNYQSIFDRQIQNLEVQQKYQRIGDIVGGLSGALGAGTQGAAAGALLGGGTGAIAGGLVSGALSGIGAIADYSINESLRNEALSYKRDMFNYSLGNIKALPYGLSRTSSFNIQNKIWPFLEYYSCTDEEKESLEKKIFFNGMTIGAFGSLRNYCPMDGSLHFLQAIYPYIVSARPHDSLDAHVESEISSEMALGIYAKGENLY